MVVAFVRPSERHAASLAEHIDALVREDRKRGGDLEGCVVFLGGPELVSRLEELARSRWIRIPLAYMKTNQPTPHLVLNPLVGTTISFVDRHVVVRNLSGYQPEAVAAATRSMVAD